MRRLDEIQRLGWIDAPSPITPLPELAARLGLAALDVKRDDLIEALGGGTKIRKLDDLLAQPPFDDQPVWRSVGAIGSGHLVALTRAAARLDRALEVEIFWEPPSPTVRGNLAEIAAGARRLRFHARRRGLLRRPSVLLHGIPPGASAPAGLVGVARAAEELRAQIEAGALERPDVIYLPLGTGGVAVGLAVGLALAGLEEIEIRAIAAVERALTPPWVIQRQIKRLCAHLGVPTQAAPIVPDYTHLGSRYGVATLASTEAVHRLAPLPLESLYSGKAMAALLAEPPRGRRVLFWLTPSRVTAPAEALREASTWAKLPAPLRRRLLRLR